MNLLNSIFLGEEGSYFILDTPVTFKNNPAPPSSNELNGVGALSAIATRCMNSKLFQLATQSSLHVLVHEMGHALTHKAFTQETAKIWVRPAECQGKTYCSSKKTTLSSWQDTIVNAAGPMANITFSLCKLAAAVQLHSYISLPVSLALGAGAIVWISGEALYAYTSVQNEDRGDFDLIAKKGWKHLTLASGALIGQIAGGLFLIYKTA